MARSRKPKNSRRSAKKLPFPERLPRLARRALEVENVDASIDAELKMDELIEGVLDQDREDLLDAALANARTEEEFLKMREEIEHCICNAMRNEDQASRMIVINVVGTTDNPSKVSGITGDSVIALQDAIKTYGAIPEESQVMLLPHLFSMEQIPIDFIPARSLHDDLYIASQGGGVSQMIEANMQVPSPEQGDEDSITLINRFLIGVVVGEDVDLSEENSFLNYQGGFDEDGMPDVLSAIDDEDFDGSDMFDIIENFDFDGWVEAATGILSGYFLSDSLTVGPPGEYFDEGRKGSMTYQMIGTGSLLMQSIEQHQVRPENTEMVISPCGDGSEATVVLMNSLTQSPMEALPWSILSATSEGVGESLEALQDIAMRIGIGSMRLHNEEEEGSLFSMAS